MHLAIHALSLASLQTEDMPLKQSKNYVEFQNIIDPAVLIIMINCKWRSNYEKYREDDMKTYEAVVQDSSWGRDQLNKCFSSVRRLMLLQCKFWFCLLSFVLSGCFVIFSDSCYFCIYLHSHRRCCPRMHNSMVLQDRRKPSTASIVLIIITNTLLCL